MTHWRRRPCLIVTGRPPGSDRERDTAAACVQEWRPGCPAFNQSSQPSGALRRGPGESGTPHGSSLIVPPLARYGESLIAIQPDTG